MIQNCVTRKIIYVLVFVFPSLANSQELEVSMLCQSERFDTDYSWIGFYNGRTEVDIISYSSGGIFLSASYLNIKVSEAPFSYTFQLNNKNFYNELKLDRNSLELIAITTPPYPQRRIQNCQLEPDNINFIDARSELVNILNSKKQKRSREIQDKLNNRKF